MTVPVAEQVAVLLLVLALLYGTGWLAHQIAWWSARTPRSGYLITAGFALYILTRSLP